MVKGLGETRERDQVRVSMETEYRDDVKKFFITLKYQRLKIIILYALIKI